MPNWVFNSVDIHGTKEQIDRFRKEALEYKSSYVEDVEGEDKFSFHAFITLPDSKFMEYRETHGFVGGNQSGDTEFNWYNWNTKNWHTKWDACNVDYVSNNEENIHIRFDTAWSPPMPVFEAMVDKFPELSFSIEWEEEQEWGGRALGRGGDFEVIEEWDIPMSHADYEARGRECGNCQGWYSNTPDEWYDDCPEKAKKIMENNMVNNTITVIGADTSVGEVVESFMDNDSINDETLYTVEKIEIYGVKNDAWNRLTGADIDIETKGGITNRYIDPIRAQFPDVDIEVVNDTTIA
jgi:hypothetical protein